MKKANRKHRTRMWAILLCIASTCMTMNQPTFATDAATAAEQPQAVPKTNLELAEERKAQKVASNERKGWPKGPAIGAEGACLMDADTGAILYDKNMDEELYPASVTKIMTCLLAVENSEMKEKVKFSADAINSVPWDGANMGMRVGEKLTMEQSLNGVLVHSANEVANGVAEHIAGSMSEFAEMMNARAKELGCTHTHFVNSNGLFDENHYTSAHDLALIGREFFSHEELCEMASKNSYTVKKTNKRPEGFTVYSKNKFFNGQYTYDTVIGSKTGFTSEARQTLVSCAERDGRKLICVILKEESPAQFEDTIQLFDYGFKQFKNYPLEKAGKLESIVGDEETEEGSICTVEADDPEAKFTLPKKVKVSKVTVEFEKTGTDTVKTDEKEEKIVTGTLVYKYKDLVIAEANVTKTTEKIIADEPQEKIEAEAWSIVDRLMQKLGLQDRVIAVAIIVGGILLITIGIGLLIWGILQLSQKKRRRRH